MTIAALSTVARHPSLNGASFVNIAVLHHGSTMDVVSLCVGQTGENDENQAWAAEVPTLTIYPSIAEALTLGGEKMAVDGVILIGEFGKYPANEK